MEVNIGEQREFRHASCPDDHFDEVTNGVKLDSGYGHVWIFEYHSIAERSCGFGNQTNCIIWSGHALT